LTAIDILKENGVSEGESPLEYNLPLPRFGGGGRGVRASIPRQRAGEERVD